MNPNREYEIFTQEVYQYLVNNDVVKNTLVQHDVKLMGRSGQEHQIDVYWEYEMSGNREIIIDGCKGVVEYGENLIKLNLGENVLTLSGSELVINSFDSGIAVINGQIGDISFVS